LHGFLSRRLYCRQTARLDCALVRPERQHPVQTCRVGDDNVDALLGNRLFRGEAALKAFIWR
jgi:hypothetical protein